MWQIGGVAALVAAVVSTLVYAAARAVGVPMELTEVFEDEYARMPVMNMAFAAVLEGGVGGTAVAVACRRWSRRPLTWFLTLTTIGLIASLALPILSDASTATKIVLSTSHVVVAGIVVPALALALARDSGHRSTISGRSARMGFVHADPGEQPGGRGESSDRPDRSA